MKKRSILATRGVLLLALAMLLQSSAGAQSARGVSRPLQTATPTPAEFLLRVPRERLPEVLARHGLTLVRAIETRDDDLFLVAPAMQRGMMSLAESNAVLQHTVTSVGEDLEVGHIEVNAIVRTPEVDSGVDINHSTVEILDALEDRALTTYFNLQVWNGYVNQPAAQAIRLAQGHAMGATGAGIVAIIDTGVDPDHPLLQGALVPGYDFTRGTAGNASEWNDLEHSTVEILDHSTVEILDSNAAPVPLNSSTVGILNSTSPLDPATLPAAFGHGTMVAGIVRLVAPTAQIMPLKAFRADGTSNLFDIVSAVYYAVDHGARVINMSFSASVPSPELARAINYATDRGVVCIASAGNSGLETVVYPGGQRNVIGVASSNSAAAPNRSTFSNFGDGLVSLAAPGEAILTTYPGGGYAGVWGTSFSAPMVAGAAAVLLQIDPALDYQKAAAHLGKAMQMTFGMGKGRMNLLEAVRTVPDATAPAVSVLTPASGATLSGTVLISASASDNIAVAGVKFLAGDTLLGPEDTDAPYELSWPTTTVANGPHLVTVIARDTAGNVTSGVTSVTVANDTGPPAVALIDPAAGSTVNATVLLRATATDDQVVSGVQFKIDGVALGAEDVAEPYELAWDTTSVANGAHTIAVVARDAAGHESTTTGVVTVANDMAPPAVAVTNPTEAAAVAGTVTLTAAATDDIAVASVQFLIDGAPFGALDLAAPFELAWPTTAAANGVHTVSAVARDTAGNQTTAATVSVTVSNDVTAPQIAITGPAEAAVVNGAVTLAATATDEVGVASVQFLLNGAPIGPAVSEPPYETVWLTTTAANTSHTLTAVARDAAGNTSISPAVTVSVLNDTAAPTVALTTPTAGSTIGGAITITATAADDVRVTSVQFLVDGAPLGEPIAAPPYTIDWTTTTAANGAHTVSAVARDAAGHESIATISLAVLNDLAAPSVAVTSPAEGTTLGGGVTVTAAASDDVGVVSVQFLLDGVPLGDLDGAAPYEVIWSTAASGNGPHTLTAVARDAAGRETVAAVIAVTVFNDITAPAVALTNPAAETIIGGSIVISADASDDVAVTSVQFLLDGVPLGDAVTQAPFELNWDTTTAPNGTRTIAAVARDAAGNESVVSVVVAVSNEP